VILRAILRKYRALVSRARICRRIRNQPRSFEPFTLNERRGAENQDTRIAKSGRIASGAPALEVPLPFYSYAQLLHGLLNRHGSRQQWQASQHASCSGQRAQCRDGFFG